MSKPQAAVVDGWHYRVVERPSLRGDRVYRSLKMVRYEGGKPVEVDATFGFAAGEGETSPLASISDQLVAAAKAIRRSRVLHIREIGA